MTRGKSYEIEFYVVEHATEFRRKIGDARAYDDAKAFLDDLVGRRASAVEPRSKTDRTSSDTYLVDEAQYRAFEAFMHRRRP